MMMRRLKPGKATYLLIWEDMVNTCIFFRISCHRDNSEEFQASWYGWGILTQQKRHVSYSSAQQSFQTDLFLISWPPDMFVKRFLQSNFKRLTEQWACDPLRNSRILLTPHPKPEIQFKPVKGSITWEIPCMSQFRLVDIHQGCS